MITTYGYILGLRPAPSGYSSQHEWVSIPNATIQIEISKIYP